MHFLDAKEGVLLSFFFFLSITQYPASHHCLCFNCSTYNYFIIFNQGVLSVRPYKIQWQKEKKPVVICYCIWWCETGTFWSFWDGGKEVSEVSRPRGFPKVKIPVHVVRSLGFQGFPFGDLCNSPIFTYILTPTAQLESLKKKLWCQRCLYVYQIIDLQTYMIFSITTKEEI